MPITTDVTAKLIEAIEKDDAARVTKILADAGKFKIDKQIDGMPAIQYAAMYGSKRALQALLDAGANINATSGADDMGDRGLTALIVAAECGKLEMVEYLIQLGADPKILTRQGCSAINFTMDTSHDGPTMKIVETLLAAGCPASAGPAVSRAVESNDLELARLLIRAGGDVNKPTTRRSSNIAGATPLALAARARILAENSREIRKLMGEPERAEREKASATELIRELLAAGADLNAPSSVGSPLAIAAAADDREMVEMLLAAGADPGAANSANFMSHPTALHACVFERRIEIARELLARGADPDVPVAKGTTAREAATKMAYTEILGLFESAKPAATAPTAVATPRATPDNPVPTEKAAPARLSRGNSSAGGARDFLRMLYDGNPEWAILLVEASLDDVAAAIRKRRKARHHEKSVAVKRRTLTGGEPLDELALVQLKDANWTIVVRRLFELDSTDITETAADAAALSKQLKTQAATFMGEDTSSAMGFERFDGGESVEKIDWSGGAVSNFRSSLRLAPEPWPGDDFDIADVIFAELGLTLPCCFPETGDNDTAAYLAADAKSAKRIARADLITF